MKKLNNNSSPSELSLETAATVWCKPSTKHKVVDTELTFEFAKILHDVWSQPWLGNATTEQLLNELKARHETNGTLHYKTTDETTHTPRFCTK